MSAPEHSPLGQSTDYANRYAPDLLFSIPRARGRDALDVGPEPPFRGVDIWNAYELSWLNRQGKPVVAMAEFRIPADSPAIVESKSFKLYLNSFSGERLDTDDVRTRLTLDLERAAGAPVAVQLIETRDFANQRIQPLAGTCIDDLDVSIDQYDPPRPDYLATTSATESTEQTLVSHLLKSNCPVTGQPDWASVQIGYTGAPIDHAGLLRYLISFREHREFHEHCVERIFMDLRQRCQPTRLDVYARYTRRGGLDINPFRSSEAGSAPENPRGARQ